MFYVYLNSQLVYIGINSIHMLLRIPFVDGILWCNFSTAKLELMNGNLKLAAFQIHNEMKI